MAQQTRAPAAKPEGQSLIPGLTWWKARTPTSCPLMTIRVPDTPAHRMGENLIQPYFRQELKSRIYKELQKLSIKETKVANQQIGG